jgi:hypothetical protein
MTEPTQEPTDLSKVFSLLNDIRSTLDKQNAEPSTTPAPAPAAAPGVAEQPTPATPTRKYMSHDEMEDIKKELKGFSRAELSAAFLSQLNREDTGIPLAAWTRAGGSNISTLMAQNPEITKALDTTGASALIRQDLEPILYELYVKMFPAWERFQKEPANGLVHAFNQITSFGDAKFMAELGTVTDDTSVYARQTTNVAILATRRGVSLKSQFAVLAGGAGYNPEALELQGGLRAMAHRMQKTIFEGNASNSGGSGSDENGTAYDANAFTGLRSILNTSRVKNADVSSSTITSQDSLRTALDRASEEIQQQGGEAQLVYTHPHEKVTFDLQQDPNVRYISTQGVDVGMTTNAVNTVFGPLPVLSVPGDSISSYTSASYSSNTVRDLYMLDMDTISLPYLGSAGPTVLDIPIGISGQLTHQYIIFGMWGLAVKAIPFSNKVRAKF